MRELVVLAAVAGHRLPYCWRDGCERENQFLLVLGVTDMTV
ncbi:MAG: hypothetical protein ACXWZL_04665 [Mycobacterium sp.]|jgi:hypothetical protein